MGKYRLLAALTSLLFAWSCEQPMDPVIESAARTNELLQKHTWHLKQFKVEVIKETIPAPVLWNISDSLVPEGIYDLDDMIFDASEMQNTMHHFTSDRDILTLKEHFALLSDSIGRYFVINDRSIRITNNYQKLIYSYSYSEDYKQLALTVNAESANALITNINEKLIDRIAKGTPEKIGNTISKILYNNEAIQRIINDALVSWISGKAEFINEIDPQEAANSIAGEIILIIQGIDWELELIQLLKGELDKITNIDADKVAQQISEEISRSINELLSINNVYDIVLPYIDQLVANPESSAKNISTLFVNLIFDVFDQDRLQDMISGAWEDFAQLDSTQVKEIADTLTFLVEDIWINQENLYGIILPFTQKIDDTSILKMGELAQQTTDAVKDVIDVINNKFPELNLEPDYTQMTGTLKAAYIAAKPLIGLAGGPEKAANDVASIILENILSTSFISNSFTSVIHYLQQLDPDIVSSTIASWLVSLEEQVAPEIINYLTELLGPILQNINPEYTAFRIAKGLNEFIGKNISAEKLQNLIYPILKKITDTNTEAVAKYIALKILETDGLKDVVNQETITQILLPIFQTITEADLPFLTQKLINDIVESGIFKNGITEERVSAMISLLLYNAAWKDVQIANNFKEATIILEHE